ncbi:hypothetical protein IMCC20628_02753 [Hoeflea sp. IMCC20628]|uniref:hypothetical protein n=1 Tax=Hoeflea sp. IMCC20628 TaxID=1620421 RepID=UPI00063BE4CE|nr:hypothetical protein [Hoeflea sp. IMCC20628]AKI01448.1 hypothetical protein IMCC20628_02753 [Hoeflea sp. IMCC20628]
MATDATSTPMHGQVQPASTSVGVTQPTSLRRPSEATRSPMALDLVELDLALDLNDVGGNGFCEAVREAAKRVNGEFLFDLPASGLLDDAQRIAVVCLSRENGGRFGLVLLSNDGDQAWAVEPDDTTADLLRFAKAFVAVLEKL